TLGNTVSFAITADHAADGTIDADQTWSISVGGKLYSYTSVAGDTDASVAAQIQAMIKGDSPAGERVTFQNMKRLTVRTFEGDDTVTFHDTAVQTIVETGTGNDSVLIGLVPQIPDRGNGDLDNPAGIPIVDLHHLTNGVSAPAYIYGGTGDDYF